MSQRASAKLIGYQSDHLGQLHRIKATLDWQGQRQQITGEASGLLSAFLDGLRKRFSVSANILDYHEHTLGKQSYSKAATYVQLEDGQDGQYYFGVGIEEDVTSASLQALLNAWSNLIQAHTAKDSATLACCK
ncbi:2-isopropylmalate synthase [Marinomonas spartinae]|nr:2-isopropylmalate synthase [Marinomonas spartinae]